MPVTDLCALDDVKAWLEIPPTVLSEDLILGRLISNTSRRILDYLQRPSLLSRTYTDVKDGHGGKSLFLENWPVTAVAALQIDSQTITPAPIGSTGYRLETWNGFPPGGPQALELVGWCYPEGQQNVSVTYTAGYLASGEAATIPASGAHTITAAQNEGQWSQDAGVTFADGTPLALVTGAPTAGQYEAAEGVYTFAAADGGKAVLLSYSYVPGAVYDACINWVAERYRYRKRVGMTSQTIGNGQTTSYDKSAIPDYIKSDLQPYRSILPLR